MPCHVDPPSSTEISQAREAALEHANFYMHRADMLREHLLAEDKANAQTVLYQGQTREMELPYINPYGYSHADRALVDEYQAEWERAVDAARKMIAGKRWARKAIEKDQIKHREVDVKRLIKTFADKGQFDKIKPLLDVDFTKPLEPQIGYDPDKY